MKQPERVVELLAELRALAETDFERHRIDVLERDLTAPPTVEQVDDTHQRFNGETYLLDRTGHHRRLNYLHRIIWNYCYGEIPLGSEIHHVDGNSLNNTIDNLQLMTAHEHKKLHRKRPAEITCPVCGKTFANNSHGAKYCSRQCAGIAKQKCYTEFGEHLKQLTCPICARTFMPKNSHQIFCSPECKNKSLSKPAVVTKCAVCGNIFSPPRKNPGKKCCSPSCSSKLAVRTNNLNKQ